MCMTTQTPDALKVWLHQQMDARNLSQTAASKRAGLAPNAISEIMNGVNPGIEKCKALASYFGVPLSKVLVLAGHIETPADERAFLTEEIVTALSSLTDSAKQRLLRALKGGAFSD